MADNSTTDDGKILGYTQPGQMTGALKQAQGAAYQVSRPPGPALARVARARGAGDGGAHVSWG